MERRVASSTSDNDVSTHASAIRVEARRLAHRAVERVSAVQPDQTLRLLDRAVELRPDYAWALAHRGELLRSLGQRRRALDDFDRALGLRPDYAWALAHRGATRHQLGLLKPALSDLDRALALTPDYAWALVYRTEVLVGQRRYKLALVDARRAIELDPDIVADWQGELGLLLNYLGRYHETIELCEDAVRVHPGDHVAWYSLSVARALAPAYSDRSEERASTIASAEACLNSALEGAKTPYVRSGALYRLAGLAALRGQAIRAVDLLKGAVALHSEPGELVRHDPAWHAMHDNPRIRSLLR